MHAKQYLHISEKAHPKMKEIGNTMEESAGKLRLNKMLRLLPKVIGWNGNSWCVEGAVDIELKWSCVRPPVFLT